MSVALVARHFNFSLTVIKYFSLHSHKLSYMSTYLRDTFIRFREGCSTWSNNVQSQWPRSVEEICKSNFSEILSHTFNFHPLWSPLMLAVINARSAAWQVEKYLKNLNISTCDRTRTRSQLKAETASRAVKVINSFSCDKKPVSLRSWIW